MFSLSSVEQKATFGAAVSKRERRIFFMVIVTLKNDTKASETQTEFGRTDPKGLHCCQK